MTRTEAKSWIDKLTPGNWVTIILVCVGFAGNYAVVGQKAEENRSGVRENQRNIQQIKEDYRAIMEKLDHAEKNDERIEKKLDRLLEK